MSSTPETPRSSVVAVVTTVSSSEEAEALARRLVGERLAACANVVPGVRSFYRWEGALQSDDELIVVFKTTAEGAPRLQSRLLEEHPYDVPEALVLPVPDGAPEYLAWVRSEVTS